MSTPNMYTPNFVGKVANRPEMKRTLKSSKSRGGCHRCKAKHIKCDETKPSCRICLANDVECPGFAKQLRWSNKHEVLAKPSQQRRQTETGAENSDLNGRADADADANGNGDVSHQMESEPTQPSFWELDNSDWPNLENFGYEDLAFSTPLLGPLPGAGMETNYVFPFLGDMGGPGPPFGGESFSNGHTGSPVAVEATRKEQGQVDNEQRRTSQAQLSASTPKNSGSGSASLLQTFYRLSSPGEVLGFSEDALVNHYFSHVCTILSCFDSEFNPFRTLVEKSWQNSRTIFTAIQSLSVAHLSNWYPYLAPMGIAKRSQAWMSLQQDLQQLRGGKRSSDTVLLSLLLLGHSAGWHQASNLGMQYLFIARNLVQAKLQESQNHPSENDEFFLDALMHWEMLASFVDPVPAMPLSGLQSPKPELPTRATPHLPHSWTGVVTQVHFALAEIGRVLRRQKNGMLTRDDEEWAAILERILRSTIIPEPDDITDYHDPKTPKTDLIRAASAYRYIGMLELYSAFPDLLRDQINQGSKLEGLEVLTPRDRSGYIDEVDSWLTSIAVHVLEIVKPISISSAACRLLPLVMVATSSQLRFPDNALSPDTVDPAIHEHMVEARYLVEARMLVLSRKYPQRPLLQMIDIVKEAWQRLDSGSSGAHWLEVAHETAWQTMMG